MTPIRRLSNGGLESGPSRLDIPWLSLVVVEVLSKMEVEDLSDRFLCQTFSANPHLYIWPYQVCPASFPPIWSNLLASNSPALFFIHSYLKQTYLHSDLQDLTSIYKYFFLNIQVFFFLIMIFFLMVHSVILLYMYANFNQQIIINFLVKIITHKPLLNLNTFHLMKY